MWKQQKKLSYNNYHRNFITIYKRNSQSHDRVEKKKSKKIDGFREAPTLTKERV